MNGKNRISEWPMNERPREKLIEYGAGLLSTAELMAILLRTGSRTTTALDLARQLLSQHGDLQELATMDYQRIAQLKGIGPVKAVTLVAAWELGRRLASLPRKQHLKISDPEIIYLRYEPLLSHLKKEMFMILLLNSANHLIRDIRVSEGTLNASLVHPREVFKPAILASAASIILLHNHPSGEAQPSLDDRNITDKIVEAGHLLDIPVLDHIIIGQKSYYSFREAGLLT